MKEYRGRRYGLKGTTSELIKRRKIYIACEQWNFIWDEQDVLEIEDMWKQGVNVYEIAEEVNRDADEVMLLIMDRAKRGKVRERQGGIMGHNDRRGARNEHLRKPGDEVRGVNNLRI